VSDPRPLHHPEPGWLILVVHVVPNYRYRYALCGQRLLDDDATYAHIGYKPKATIHDDPGVGHCVECRRLAAQQANERGQGDDADLDD
jgi:hypothetical protein